MSISRLQNDAENERRWAEEAKLEAEFDELRAEVARLDAIVSDARSYALSLNAGRGELPGWAQLRVDLLVEKLNGSSPKGSVES